MFELRIVLREHKTIKLFRTIDARAPRTFKIDCSNVIYYDNNFLLINFVYTIFFFRVKDIYTKRLVPSFAHYSGTQGTQVGQLPVCTQDLSIDYTKSFYDYFAPSIDNF